MLVDLTDSAQAIVDPKDAAESAGLRYVSDARPGIHRKKAGRGFTYTRADGSKLSESDVLKRIKDTNDLPQMPRPSGSAELLHVRQSGHRAQVESGDRASERRGKPQTRRVRVLALLRTRLAKEAEGSRMQRARVA